MVVVITLKEFALPILFGYFVFAPPINQLRLRATASVSRHATVSEESAEASPPGEASFQPPQG